MALQVDPRRVRSAPWAERSALARRRRLQPRSARDARPRRALGVVRTPALPGCCRLPNARRRCVSRSSRICAETSADSARRGHSSSVRRPRMRFGTATAPTAPSTAATGSRSGRGSTSGRPSSDPLLLSATAVRSFSVVVEPVPPARARSAVEAAVTSDEADEQLRRERGFRTTARRRKQQAATRAA